MAAGIIQLGNTRGLFSTASRSSRCAEQIERFGGPMKRIVPAKDHDYVFHSLPAYALN
jgi:hypothetical protein